MTRPAGEIGRSPNENRPGYKKTKVGWIPEGWGCVKGSEITSLIGKGASPKWQGFNYVATGMLFVTSENVRDGYLDVSVPKFLPLTFHTKLKRTQLRRGDILINLVGASIGRSCRVKQDLGSANVNQAVAVFRVRDSHSVPFVEFFFQAPETVKRILDMQVDAARPNISLTDLRDFQIPLPTLPEQHKISEILSAWDNAIEKTAALLSQKRLAFNGYRIELLQKPNVGNSKKYRLSEISSEITRRNDGSDVSAMMISSTRGFIDQSEKYGRDMTGESLQKYILLKKGEFAYNRGNSKTYPYGCIFRLEANRALIPFVYTCFKLNKDVEPRYFRHYFEVGSLNRQLHPLISSSARGNGLLNINDKYFFSCKVPVPDIAYQRKSADFLDRALLEIRLLERRLEIYRLQKKGLMQKLLRGQIRVKV